MTADTEAQRAGRDAMRALVEREGPASVATQMLPKLLGASTQRDQPDLSGAVRMLIESNRTEAVAGAIGALKNRPDRTAALGAVQVPTLVICGAEDTLTPPADSEAMAATIPGAQLAMIPNAGHLSNLEQPNAFNEALRLFLK
jgi:pimeloyl-ACP methyl ester carboxylesterase